MKKSLIAVLALLPFITFAQKDPPVFENFAKNVKSTNTLTFDDHLNIMQLTTDDDKFYLTAVNDQMKVVWSASFVGYGIKIAKFNNKIVALAFMDHKSSKSLTDTFLAYIIDPATGKLLLNKIVYQSPDDFIEIPKMYTGDGSFFKLAVRRTGMKRRSFMLHSITRLLTDGSEENDFNQTQKLKVMSYDDKLDLLNSYDAVISNGQFMSLIWNKHADMFVSWLNGSSIDIYKYDAGKTTSPAQLSIPVTFKIKKYIYLNNILFLHPADQTNLLYYSLLYKNQNNEMELGIGKLDFASNKTNYATQEISKNYLKEIEKTVIPNKEIDNVDLGSPDGMQIKYINESSGTIVLALSSGYYVSSGRSVENYEKSALIVGYDQNLKLKFQQVLPYKNSYPERDLTTGYYVSNDKLYAVGNNRTKFNTVTAVFGILDLNNGKWDKLTYLSKNQMNKSDYSDGESILWFSNSFIVPYTSPNGFSSTGKYSITLQLNQY